MRLYQSIVFVLAVLGLCVGAAPASGGQQGLNSIVGAPKRILSRLGNPLNQTPYTYLLDTGVPSPDALSERELAQKTGWTIVAEDNIRHKFKGDTVFLNDKITVVLRRSGSGAEVYSKTADGLKRRARLFACAGRADQAARLSSVRIIENNPAAVVLEAVFQTQQGKNVTATYWLTTGQIYLEISPGKGMNRLFIRANTRYVVVPDFFGDDVVFSPEGFEGSPLPRLAPGDAGASRIGLPAENFLLLMLEGNDAIVMCVWESDAQNAQAISSSPPAFLQKQEGEESYISGYDRDPILQGTHIQCIKDKRIWVAFMESSNIWHERLIWDPALREPSDEDKGRDIVLDWEPPFPAKWRADFIKKDELAESWNFRDEQEPAATGGHDHTGLRPAVSAAVDELTCSCWFDGDRPCVRVPELQAEEKSEGGAVKYPWPVIVYPIDRTRATPLMVFCPVDIVRNTLGVGPCQYILEKEGFGSELHPTPDQVTRWVENLFKKKKEKRASTQIKERFKQMVEHIRQAQTRIKQYGDFAKKLRKLSEEEKSNKAVEDALGKLLGIVDDLEQNIVTKSNSAKPSESAARLADKIIALIGKDGALARCQKLGSQIRAIGAAQDKALSKCRMAVRRIKQQCLMMPAKEPQAIDFAAKIQKQAEQMLYKK